MKNHNVKKNQSIFLSKLSKKNVYSLKKSYKNNIETNMTFEDWIHHIFHWDKKTVLTYNTIPIILYFITILSSKNSPIIIFIIFLFIYSLVLISVSFITAMDNKVNPVLYIKSKLIYLIY